MNCNDLWPSFRSDWKGNPVQEGDRIIIVKIRETPCSTYTIQDGAYYITETMIGPVDTTTEIWEEGERMIVTRRNSGLLMVKGIKKFSNPWPLHLLLVGPGCILCIVGKSDDRREYWREHHLKLRS